MTPFDLLFVLRDRQAGEAGRAEVPDEQRHVAYDLQQAVLISGYSADGGAVGEGAVDGGSIT